jgi:hypothetical protein
MRLACTSAASVLAQFARHTFVLNGSVLVGLLIPSRCFNFCRLLEQRQEVCMRRDRFRCSASLGNSSKPSDSRCRRYGCSCLSTPGEKQSTRSFYALFRTFSFLLQYADGGDLVWIFSGLRCCPPFGRRQRYWAYLRTVAPLCLRATCAS